MVRPAKEMVVGDGEGGGLGIRRLVRVEGGRRGGGRGRREERGERERR